MLFIFVYSMYEIDPMFMFLLKKFVVDILIIKKNEVFLTSSVLEIKV